MNRKVRADLVPLFDRLAGVDLGAADGVLLDAEGLRKSLALDLHRLLSTRNGCTIDRFLVTELSVADYGLPDVSALWPSSKTDRDLMAEVVEVALAAFEPRLKHVMVEVLDDPRQPTRVFIRLAAVALLNEQPRRVEFDMAIDARTGQAEVNAT